MNDKDVALISNYLMTKSEDISQISPILLSDKIIISEEYKKKILDDLKDDMELKAISDLKNPNVLVAIRTNQAGGSTSVNNSKPSSKAAKGKVDKSKKQGLSDELNVDLSFMTENQLQKKLSDKNKDISDDVVESVVSHILK